MLGGRAGGSRSGDVRGARENADGFVAESGALPADTAAFAVSADEELTYIGVADAMEDALASSGAPRDYTDLPPLSHRLLQAREWREFRVRIE